MLVFPQWASFTLNAVEVTYLISTFICFAKPPLDMKQATKVTDHIGSLVSSVQTLEKAPFTLVQGYTLMPELLVLLPMQEFRRMYLHLK